ncbi:hypothetical protein ALC60_11014 [Trachymyrmex zeteki]|uniref:Uncharacterized protein n=1 Tax=Mycetomoellerius zeteki TaxID=64791 RepID=A0A151WPL3_9HYME|nr:hypothetical protein ALC60_11014 [Trachymyrmex zeteki]
MFDGKRGWRAGGWRRLTGIRVRGRHGVEKRDEVGQTAAREKRRERGRERQRARDRVSFRGESVDIKARRNDATERTNKRINERVRQANGQTDGRTNVGANVHTCAGEQNASADLVAYLWLRYPVVNKVPHGRDIGVYLRAVGAHADHFVLENDNNSPQCRQKRIEFPFSLGILQAKQAEQGRGNVGKRDEASEPPKTNDNCCHGLAFMRATPTWSSSSRFANTANIWRKGNESASR